ncbi:Synapse-associated protein 1 [Merluccius polli]|uniref:Synapse-associated protein 1 n=1 Tax=Merluccius polli TaxID=89951 RepID=A0AA47MEK9_MERPO|nr:Synapse-associated protein 1 [Merluccius polli]
MEMAAENDELPTTDALPPHPLQRAKGFGGLIYDFASSASKQVSLTAQTIKKSVEEGKFDGIIDKTILGEFQKEQEKFVQEKNAKQLGDLLKQLNSIVGVAVPPWVGFNDEESIQQQILALSADKRIFLREPPAGVQFPFDFLQMSPVAMVMLEEDELLSKMRFHLVPKQVKEEAFWRNYFYRVSLIKQSAQISLLAAQRPQTPESPDPDQHKGTVRQKSTLSAKHELSVKDEDISTCPEEDVPDWEKELQLELQEYEVVANADEHDDHWHKELEEMLQEDL